MDGCTIATMSAGVCDQGGVLGGEDGSRNLSLTWCGSLSHSLNVAAAQCIISPYLHVAHNGEGQL